MDSAEAPGKNKRGAFRPLDWLIFTVSIAAVLAVSVFAYGDTAAASEVSIQSDEGEFLYSLADNRSLEFEGPIGTTVVEIQDNHVRVHESPCRDQICVAAGWLETTGEWSACLPNRIFVRVEGGENEDGVDAQTF